MHCIHGCACTCVCQFTWVSVCVLHACWVNLCALLWVNTTGSVQGKLCVCACLYVSLCVAYVCLCQPWCHVSPSQNPGTYHHCLKAQFLTWKMETHQTHICCAFTGLSGPRPPFCECGSHGVTAQAPRSPAWAALWVPPTVQKFAFYLHKPFMNI